MTHKKQKAFEADENFKNKLTESVFGTCKIT